MQVWIVIEEDRGMGPMVSGVHSSEEAANAACGGNESVQGPYKVDENADG